VVLEFIHMSGGISILLVEKQMIFESFIWRVRNNQ